MQTKMDCVTIGIQAAIDQNKFWPAIFIFQSKKYLEKNNGLPDMAVGSPEAKALRYEDHGRTVIIPLPMAPEKLYACKNETGGYTYMLAQEY